MWLKKKKKDILGFSTDIYLLQTAQILRNIKNTLSDQL